MTPESANHPVDCEALSEAFLSLHEADGFTRLPPSSLLHDSVPMSFVMSAGLIQVENNLDKIIEETGGTFAFTQPCFRHFDMKQVGEDPTRLSLFHMSAAFHIGSSQRETILPRLWHFLTHTLKLKKEQLWISYLDDEELGKDEASYQCWKDTGVQEDHLIGLNQHHCFWRQRSTGQIASDGKKCGPHTEVFYERPDMRCDGCEHRQQPQACIGNCRKGRFVEISNSLFIENYLDEEGGLIAADTVFSECVVGLERIAMILQDVPSVYHTQRFSEWQKILETQVPNLERDPEIEASINIILDHLSAFLRLTKDGAPEPGRGGRKYIMRKLVRGAMTHSLILDMEPIQLFKKLYNLINKTEFTCVIGKWENEYERYKRTLQRGYQELEKYDIKKQMSNSIHLRLEKTHGLHVSLAKQHASLVAVTDPKKSVKRY